MVYEVTHLVSWHATKLINLTILELQWFLYSTILGKRDESS